jgi:hypothetical protein
MRASLSRASLRVYRDHEVTGGGERSKTLACWRGTGMVARHRVTRASMRRRIVEMGIGGRAKTENRTNMA